MSRDYTPRMLILEKIEDLIYEFKFLESKSDEFNEALFSLLQILSVERNKLIEIILRENREKRNND